MMIQTNCLIGSWQTTDLVGYPGDSECLYDRVVESFDQGKKTVVALVKSPDDKPTKQEASNERDANARLIAAAPDLLKACKEINKIDTVDYVLLIQPIVTAAIQKATKG